MCSVDGSTLRLMYRLSLAVTVLLCSVVSVVSGVDLPMGRTGEGVAVFGILGSVVAIMFITGNLRRRQLGPQAAAWGTSASLYGLVADARRRSSVALERWRRSGRVRKVEHAARAVAGDDDRLDPQSIRAAAEALFRLVCLAWDARDVKGLETLLAPELLAARRRELAANDIAGEHHRAQVIGDVRVELVGLTVDADAGPTAVVLIEAVVDRGVERDGSRPLQGARPVSEYWTLVTRGDAFVVQAIEGRTAGARHLTEPIVTRARQPA